MNFDVGMNKRAVKCTKCEKGFRHPVGNCVLCGKGPAPYFDGEETNPDKFPQKLLELSAQLNTPDILNPEDRPFAFWPKKDPKRPYWTYDMYISLNSKL